MLSEELLTRSVALSTSALGLAHELPRFLQVNSRRRNTASITAALITLIGVGSAFAGSEWRLRDQVRRANATNPYLSWMIFYTQGVRSVNTFQSVVERIPRFQLSFRMYGPEGKLFSSADMRLNNLGFFSDRDYSLERGPHEFRIVVIGGEQTASTVVSHSWPDLLENELNRRDPSRRYKVFDIAWPDNGPQDYVKDWRTEGVKFSPDLVIVNYVETDFFREGALLNGARLAYHSHLVSMGEIRYRVGPGADDVALAITPIVRGYRATSFRDPMAIPGRPYGFYVSRAFMDDQRRVRALQRQVLNDMIEGALPPFGALTLRALAGKSTVIDVAAVRNFDPLPSQPADRVRMIQHGISTFGWLADHVPHLLLTHNFNYYELQGRFELTEGMLARDSHIQVVDMRQRIPVGTSSEEIKSWYQIPYLGEKWSERGHEAYARMMADVVLGATTGRLRAR